MRIHLLLWSLWWLTHHKKYTSNDCQLIWYHWVDPPPSHATLPCQQPFEQNIFHTISIFTTQEKLKLAIYQAVVNDIRRNLIKIKPFFLFQLLFQNKWLYLRNVQIKMKIIKISLTLDLSVILLHCVYVNNEIFTLKC